MNIFAPNLLQMILHVSGYQLGALPMVGASPLLGALSLIGPEILSQLTNATYAYIRLVDLNTDTLVLAISWCESVLSLPSERERNR